MQRTLPNQRLNLILILLLFLFPLSILTLRAQSTGIIAHRGAWKKTDLPQNSIASLKQALALGCMGSEFDVQLTSDDSLVVNHDPVYQGDSIERSTYQKLIQTRFSNGEPMATLRSYLETGLKQNQTKLILEIKPSVISPQRAIQTTKKVLQMVKAYEAVDKIIFISFDYQVLLTIHSLYPTAETQYLNGDKSPEALHADGINGADYHFSVFQKHPDWMKSAKKLGVVLNAWTVNDSATIDWLLANRFDAITTNEPELAFQRVKRFDRIYGNRKLVFSDEFNLNGLPDKDLWAYDTGNSGWGNHELENYTEGDTNNTFIQKGLLHIRALKDSKEEKGYTSARLVMREGYQYGRIEISAKLPAGRGLWPALWLLPDKSAYGGWPKSGEIDLMENVGYMPDSLFFTVHTGKYNHVLGTQKSKGIYDTSLYTKFHEYALEWTPEKISFYLDEKLCFSFKNEHSGSPAWPFDQKFHVLMNLAVGGDWGGKNGVDPNVFPATMQIDYVRIFQ